MNRLPYVVYIFLVGLLVDPRRAEAAAPPVTVEVLADAATEIDPAALREAVARELDTAVVPGAAITLVVSIDRDRGELVVERRDTTGGLKRRVPLPADSPQRLREAVFLIGNLARDEAEDVLQELRPQRTKEPPAPGAPIEESHAGKPDAKPNLGPQGSVVGSLAPRPPPDARARVWLGMSLSVDLDAMRSASDACANGEGISCVDSTGNIVLAAPDGGGRVSGLAVGNVRWLATADYAATENFLFGVRIGYVFNAYPRDAYPLAAESGPPIQLETRATYVVGDDPLGSDGLAPYVVVAGGIVFAGPTARCTGSADLFPLPCMSVATYGRVSSKAESFEMQRDALPVGSGFPE